jgi:hypothetical protein
MKSIQDSPNDTPALGSNGPIFLAGIPYKDIQLKQHLPSEDWDKLGLVTE